MENVTAAKVQGTEVSGSEQGTAGGGSLTPMAAASNETSDAAGQSQAAGMAQNTRGETARTSRSSGSTTEKIAAAGRSKTASTAATASTAHASGTVTSTFSAEAVRGASETGALRTATQSASTDEGGLLKARVEKTFETLDSSALPEKGSWIHTGSKQAEAGYEDPALGWVGVRADVDKGSGAVHAVLVPGSATAMEALSGHVAGLQSYLAEHNSSVGTVTVAQPESGQAGFDQGQGSRSGSEGQNSGQGTQSQAAAVGLGVSLSGGAPASTVMADASGTRGDGETIGLHLSVVA
jgi:hypothetical protein